MPQLELPFIEKDEKEVVAIACAAIKDEMGNIWWGKRHADAIFIMNRLGTKFHSARCEQDFINLKGEFLTRKEAGVVALKLGQTTNKLLMDELYSEDLY